MKHIPEEFRDRFLCNECDFVSISAVNIVLHKKYEHSGRKQFQCEIEGCKKNFSRPGQLKAHIRLTHQKVRDKICKVCKRTFSTSKFEVLIRKLIDLQFLIIQISATRLKEHIITIHSKNSVRDFACEYCAKQFVTLRQLKNHQVYHDEPKFQCQMGCDKKFFKEVLLNGHHKTHLKIRDFVCPLANCGQKYFLKSHMSRHIRSVHEKIK